MKSILLFFSFFLFANNVQAQTSIDGSIDFQDELGKKFSIYVPSSYDETVDQKLIIGFHPLNTNRWDAQAWRDTLMVFSESVDAILLCPDGGPNGKVDDAIDTAFTSFILDSIKSIYPIDVNQIYGMGFSWGGRTTYTYGLHRPGIFNGHLVIGAAINGTSEVSPVLNNANKKSFYIIHGTNDSPNIRFNPIKTALEDIGACVETNLLEGINHTIDFPNRNQILKTGFEWLENRNCGTSANEEFENDIEINIFPNPGSGTIYIQGMKPKDQLSITSLDGQKLDFKLYGNRLEVNGQLCNICIVTLTRNDKKISKKIRLQH